MGGGVVVGLGAVVGLSLDEYLVVASAGRVAAGGAVVVVVVVRGSLCSVGVARGGPGV